MTVLHGTMLHKKGRWGVCRMGYTLGDYVCVIMLTQIGHHSSAA